MEVSVAGTQVVVVPPCGVGTDETRLDVATGTLTVPPFEVTTLAELTEETEDGVDEITDETGTGTVVVEPLEVVIT
jgi:hypothetical protein